MLMACVFGAGPVWAEGAPELKLSVTGAAVGAVEGAACDAADMPDTPARAVRLADGTVQVYATEKLNRLESGPDLLRLRHGCAVVYAGGEKDDPGAYDDRAWLASPWTRDGRTIWAVVHNEFQGQRRPALCPTGKYLDCWFNSLTLAVSSDGGRRFRRAPGVVAELPYRYEEVGRGHHGYFNPSNIVSLGEAQYMMAFATQAGVQREGNCLLRTTDVGQAGSWRAWDGAGFGASFADPYAGPVADPAAHVCAPVGAGKLRWPVTSLVRHAPSGLFIATMLNGARGGWRLLCDQPRPGALVGARAADGRDGGGGLDLCRCAADRLPVAPGCIEPGPQLRNGRGDGRAVRDAV